MLWANIFKLHYHILIDKNQQCILIKIASPTKISKYQYLFKENSIVLTEPGASGVVLPVDKLGRKSETSFCRRASEDSSDKNCEGKTAGPVGSSGGGGREGRWVTGRGCPRSQRTWVSSGPPAGTPGLSWSRLGGSRRTFWFVSKSTFLLHRDNVLKRPFNA